MDTPQDRLDAIEIRLTTVSALVRELAAQVVASVAGGDSLEQLRAELDALQDVAEREHRHLHELRERALRVIEAAEALGPRLDTLFEGVYGPLGEALTDLNMHLNQNGATS